MIFSGLINNIALIIAMSIFYSFIIRRWKYGTRLGQVISGFLFGAVAVVGMMNPVIFSPGLIFDGRSIIISIAGFIGGWVTGLIATLISVIYRVWLGGPGEIMGVSVIVSSAVIGIAYHTIRRRRPEVVTPLYLYGFGIIVHLCMLALTMTLPSGMKYEVLSKIAMPVILIYPLGTLLVCSVFLELEARLCTEDALRESEKNYQNLFENANEAIFVAQDGHVVFHNPRTETMVGYSPVDLLSRPFIEFIYPDDRELVMGRHLKRIKGEVIPQKYDFRIIHKDGQVRWVELNTVAINWKGRTATLNFLNDITERKKSEENNRLMLDILQLLNRMEGQETLISKLLGSIKQATGIEAIGLRLRSSQDYPYYFVNGYSEMFVEKENLLCARNQDGTIIRNSDGLPVLECTCGLVLSGKADLSLPFFSKGGSFWDNEASKLLELTPEEDPRATPRNNCIYEGYESIALIPLRAGEEIIGLLHLSDRRKGHFSIEMIQFLEEIAASVGIALHHKQDEDQIQASLEEKEILLREIHHRVKNNLQVIQSLLNLQAGMIKEPLAREVFKESQNRIRAMALVHEMLYQSSDFSHIDIADYLRNLSTRLFHASQVSPDKVKLKLGVEEVQVGINQAVPMGLILNELISNALKHAFPGERKGEIRVGIARLDGGMIRLRVGDNGSGFSKELDFRETESMGFKVVMALVEQLEGSITLHREEGTEFQITFLEGKKEKNLDQLASNSSTQDLI